jgi:hypothetical protein
MYIWEFAPFGYLWISLDIVGYERISLGYLWAK